MMTVAPAAQAVDVHQHLWPDDLLDRLRSRTETPYLRDWTLHTAGEAPYVVDPAAHDAQARVALDQDAGIETACLSLSAPLGLEALPDAESRTLLDAWHTGVVELPDHFAAWASFTQVEPDLAGLTRLLGSDRFVGLQLPATQVLTPEAWDAVGPVLRLAELADKPVLVHPGPVDSLAGGAGAPGWWAPVVGYVQQLHAAWWAWHAARVRDSFPGLRAVFAAAAGLAPVHHERHVIRGGDLESLDRDLFVDTSGYGPRALDAVVRTLGIDALVLGSDRPYAEPLGADVDRLFGDAATHAIRVTNPRRLLGTATQQQPQTPGTTPSENTATTDVKGGPRWASAS